MGLHEFREYTKWLTPTPAKLKVSKSKSRGILTWFELVLTAASPTWIDYVLLAGGFIFAAGAGVPFPLMGLIFGNLIDNFNSATCSAESTTSTVDAFTYQAAINAKVIQTAWIGAIALVLIYGHLTCWNIASQRLAQRLRARYVSALLRQPPAFFDVPGSSGQVSSRLQGDIAAVQAGTSEKVGNIITTISFFITVLVIAFSRQPALAGMLLACTLPPFLISGLLGGRFVAKFFGKSAASAAQAGSIASEALEHISVVQSFGAAPRLVSKFSQQMERARNYAIVKSTIMAIQTGMLYFISYCANSLAFWQGSILIAASVSGASNQASVGEIYAIVFLLVDACVMLGGIAPSLPFLGGAVAAYERLKEDIETPSAIDGTSDEGLSLASSESSRGKSFRFHNVDFEYPTRPGQLALENINLEFPAGKYTAIVGLSGSGKSTLASMLVRLLDPSEGTIDFDGHEMRTLNVRYLRSVIGVVQQDCQLLNRSIFENIALGLVNSSKPEHQRLKPFLVHSHLSKTAELVAERQIKHMETSNNNGIGPELDEIVSLVCRASEQADAAEFISCLDQGYGTSVGIGGASLSGGQRQRIALARALIRDPEVLLLDEATASLDSASEKRIMDHLDSTFFSTPEDQRRTVISIAHRISTIRKADSIVVLKAGRVVEQGTYDELIAKGEESGEFAKMAKLQIGGVDLTEEKSVDKVSEDISDAPTMDDSMSEKHEGIHVNSVVSQSSEPDVGKKGGSFVFKGLYYLIRPNLAWFVLAVIAAFIVGSTFSGQGIIFGFTVGALNPCEAGATAESLRAVGRFFAGLFFMLAVVEFLANFFAWWGFGIVAERLLYNLRVLALRSLLEKDILTFHQAPGQSPSGLLSIITGDAVAVGAFSGSTFGTVLGVCVNIVVAVIISLCFAWKIALVCMVTLPILLGSGFMQLRMLARYEERHRGAFTTATSLATEAIQSIRTVAVLSLEREYMEEYQRLLKGPKKEVVRNAISTNVWLAISYSCGIFVNALAYWWGSQLIMKGEYTQTDFLIILVAMLTSAQLWSSMFSLAPEFSRAKLALSRVMEVIDKDATKSIMKSSTPECDIEAVGQSKAHLAPPAAGQTGGASIVFDSVSFSYPSRPDKMILNGMSFTLPQNQFCGLVGPSGAGKSTIMNMVQRLYHPTSGTITMDGVNIANCADPNEFRKSIAIVPQSSVLFDGSIRFNVGLGAAPGHEASQEEIEEACRAAAIHEDIVNSFPDGYDTECGASSSSRLSGGQRQRIAIARALVRKPRLLLLDESTSALDAKSEALLQEGLEKAAMGTTVLAITHRLRTVQKADVIFVVEGGKIVDKGTHNELMTRRESYRLNAMQQMLQ